MGEKSDGHVLKERKREEKVKGEKEGRRREERRGVSVQAQPREDSGEMVSVRLSLA